MADRMRVTWLMSPTINRCGPASKPSLDLWDTIPVVSAAPRHDRNRTHRGDSAEQRGNIGKQIVDVGEDLIQRLVRCLGPDRRRRILADGFPLVATIGELY